MAFTQAPTERPMYMEIPKRYMVSEGIPSDYVLEILANTYGAKQAPRQWFQYLCSKLEKAEWQQSKIMPTVFYHQKLSLIKVFYVNNSIILGPTEKVINKAVDQLRKLKLELTVEGDVSDFLGVYIDKIGGNIYHLHQQHQIERVINDLNLHHDNVKTKAVPCKISEVLKRDRDGTPLDQSFDYRSIIGKLNHIE